MAIGRDGLVFRQLRTLFDTGAIGGLTDGQLLERFATRPPEVSEAAFAALVGRHGPMVLRVCRGVLPDPHDAEDAFQATFLVLVGKARRLWVRDSLGPWLHQVAYRTACCARSDAIRRRRHERRAAERDAARRDGDGSDPAGDLERALHEEIARLPGRHRAAVVLCDLEGRTHEQAARHLGCPVGTVKSRLARRHGGARLIRRGLAPLAAPTTAVLSPKATSAAVPASLAASTARAAVRLAAGGAAAGIVPAAVTSLMEGVVRSMMMTQLKIAAATLLAVGVAAGAVVLAQQGQPAGPRDPQRGRLSSLTPRHPGDVGDGSGPGTALVTRAVSGQTLKGHALASTSVAFSPDGKVLASGGADRTVKLWDAATGGDRSTLRLAPQSGPHAAVMALAFSPDGARLAMACDDLTIRLSDVASGEERARLPQGYFSLAVAFAPDGRTLAWAGSSPGRSPEPAAGDPWRVITFWDVAAGKKRAALAGHTGGIGSLAFSADGTTIASGSYDQTVKLWDAASGKELATLKGPRAVHGVAISPDGRVVAAATGNQYSSDDERMPTVPGTVMLWDVATRRERAALPGHEGSARAVAFSPDGKTLASGGQDGLVRLWDVGTGKERAILRGHRGYVYSVAFAPDGKSLASAGVDTTVRLWHLGELLSLCQDQQ